MDKLNNYLEDIKRMLDILNQDNCVQIKYISMNELEIISLVPIPSSKTKYIEYSYNKEGEKIVIYHYSINFLYNEIYKDYLFDFAINNNTDTTFYWSGEVYKLDIRIYNDVNTDYFNITFNNVDELITQIKNQMRCDLQYRIAWFNENKEKIREDQKIKISNSEIVSIRLRNRKDITNGERNIINFIEEQREKESNFVIPEAKLLKSTNNIFAIAHNKDGKIYFTR